MQTHNKEPWIIESGPINIADKDGNVIAHLRAPLSMREPNLKRAVDCVNACAGFENPKESVDVLIKMAAKLFSLANEIDCRIEHGAECSEHLKYIHNQIKEMTNGTHT